MRVLITGAAGLLGTEVAQRLIAHGAGVIALVHSQPELRLNDGKCLPTRSWSGDVDMGCVNTVAGDVTARFLGLPDHAYHALAASVDLVIHSAAVTEFGRPAEEYMRVNVEGTRQVVAFASTRKIPLVHISTAYVCGKRQGLIREEEAKETPVFGNAYEESKFRGEALVREARKSGLASIILRPSIVVGSGASGKIREFKNIYVLLKALTSGRVGAIPGNYNATLDLVPLDYVAAAVTTAALEFGRHAGSTCHIVGRQPITLRDFSDVLAEYPAMRVPRFIPPSSFSPATLPPVERRVYRRIVAHYDSYFSRELEFADENMLSLMGGTAPARGRPFLRRLLNYCERVGFLGADGGEQVQPSHA